YALLAEEMAFNTEAVQQFLTDVGATHDPEAFKEAEEAARSFREGIARFKVLYKGKNDPESVKKLEEIEGDFNSFYEQGKLMARAYVDEGTAAGNKIMRDFDKNSDNISGKVREFKKGQRDEANKVLQMLADSLVRTRALLWFLATCVVIMGMVVSWLITRSITRPVTEAVTFARAVAEGDFTKTIDVKGGGEIGDLTTALNAMVEGLNGMVRKIKESSGELTQVSRNIFDVSKRVIGAAAVQANGVQDTSSAIVEISASIKGIANGVDSLAQSAAESSSSTLEMAASVEEVALNVETLAASAEGVSASITETAAAVRQIDGSAATLKEAYTRTAVSVAQMDGSVRQVEQNARAAAAISGDVLRDAETGKASVEATGAGIKEIRRSSAITAEVIATLSERAEQIGAILSVIDQVAGQTNLLALNAAIIAAQAGEHGKGFAVVAEEIKALAERTSSSTREIGEVIRGVQNETHRAVEAIAEAEKSIEDGELLSHQSGEALAKIVSGMKKASDQVAEIAGATVEQAKG
ncbi:MAG TPA: HAMP domain-containing methyl-accepting chemotaxis protein, partial [Geobacteraceae bacterium]|nr:HAMP domain-containing methyl-accepting chemotaxis protein [Geobacteraceae bacterium]